MRAGGTAVLMELKYLSSLSSHHKNERCTYAASADISVQFPVVEAGVRNAIIPFVEGPWTELFVGGTS